MTTITDFPAIRPSLLLDFANSGRVDPRISSTRASTATCYGPDGVLRTVASNVPRIDFDPLTGKCLGLLVEEARTNLLLNSVFAGAASGSPGTAPTNFPFSVGNGSTEVIPGGLYTTIRLSTATAARHFLTQLNTPVEVGQYAFSLPCNFYVASSVGNFLGASAGTAVFTARYFVDGVEIASGTSVGTGKKTVSMLLEVTTAGTISMRFGVGVVVSTVGEVEFSLPQLEKCAFPTSPILTTTAAATRAADIVSFTGAAPLATNFSVVQEVSLVGAPASDGTFGLSVYAEENKRFRFMCSGARNIYFSYKFNEEITKNITLQNIAVGSFVRCALSVTPNGLSVTSSGGEPLKADASVSVGAYPELSLGTYRKTNPIASVSSRIRSLAFYNQALSNSQLKRLTA